MIFRKLICKLFGHRYRLLNWWQTTHSTMTDWECQCCKEQDNQQWDNSMDITPHYYNR